MTLTLVLITAIGLSMDAFSVAILYGTLGLSKKIAIKTAVIVGLFHFLMPTIGFYAGDLILSIIRIKPETFAGIIFVVLASVMIISLKEKKEIKALTTTFTIVLFAFTVSVDSLSVGVSLAVLGYPAFLSAFVFMVMSGLITYFGISLGAKLESKFGYLASMTGSFILLFLGLLHLF